MTVKSAATYIAGVSTDNAPPVPYVPPAQPVPPGDGYFERLAAPLPKEMRRVREPLADGEPETVPESAAEREARRLTARLPAGYVPTSGADLTFDPRIAYELALGLASPKEVFAKYGVEEVAARALIANAIFIGTIKRYKEEVTSTGISFKLKAKIQAEDLLTHSYILATDPEVPAAVRADLIKWTAKMAGLEPSDKDKSGGGGSAGFTLNISFSGSPAPVGGRVIDATDVQVIEERGRT